MRQNITRVQERGENVDRLGDKTQGLSDSAANFRRGANRVRKQMFWKNMKMRFWVIIGIIILLLVIIIPSKAIPWWEQVMEFSDSVSSCGYQREINARTRKLGKERMGCEVLSTGLMVKKEVE